MDNKYSTTGIALSCTGLLISGFSLRHWSNNDGIDTFLAPLYAKLTSLFFSAQKQELGFTSEGFAITEEFATYLTMGVGICFGLLSLVLSFVSLKRQENITFVITTLLLGNAIFILYSLKIALVILVSSGCYAVYLKSQLQVK